VSITMNGKWKIKVIEKNAGWNQRFVISGSSASDGAYPGTVGTEIQADGATWTVQVQARGGSGPWLDSKMRMLPEILSGISMIRRIETDDQGGTDEDYDDLVLEAREQVDPIIEIVQRPYSINSATLMMNPDGIFLAGGGVQVMAVRVRNTWTHDMSADQLLDISHTGRAQLAAVGIQVIDDWSPSELADFNQQMVGPTRKAVIGSLPVGGERTVYFKLDFTNAIVGTPKVEFISHRSTPEPDIDDPARYAARKIFVTRVRYNPATREVSAETPEGQMHVQMEKITLDPNLYNQMRDCVHHALQGKSGNHLRKIHDELLRLLKQLESGRCDPCMLQRLIALYCECIGVGGDERGRGDSGSPGIAGVTPCPFPWFPLAFTYTVESPFDGHFGPLPFQDPWWKVIFAIITVLLAIIAALVNVLDEAHENPNIVIGEVDRFSTNNVDAALVKLNIERDIDLGVLDAQKGEPHVYARIGLGQTIPIERNVAAPFVGMRVYKSGARTGLTHGVVTSINATTIQCRGKWDNESGCEPDPDRPNLVMKNQIHIAEDPSFPGEPTTRQGDSGSLWLSNEPATQDQVVALTHSADSDSSDANPISDVLAELAIQLKA
jgi:hypothetical protein